MIEYSIFCSGYLRLYTSNLSKIRNKITSTTMHICIFYNESECAIISVQALSIRLFSLTH